MRQIALAFILVSTISWAPRSHAQTLTEYGMPPGAYGPQKIALGPDGNLWFTAEGSDSIGRITPSGDVSAFPVPGPCDELGCSPLNIAAGPDGAMWYTEVYSGMGLGRVTMDGVVTEDIVPPPLGHIGGLTSHGGYLWFAAGYWNVARMTPTGEFTLFPIAGYTALPWSICSGDGGVWFSVQNANRIGRVSDDGVVTEIPLPRARAYPRGIVVGPDGGVWFVESGPEQGNALGRLDPVTFAVEEFVIPSPHSSPSEIVVGSDGRLWFTESYQLGSFDITTHEFREYRWRSDLYPRGIAAGPDGRIWVCENGQKIGAITAEWLVAEFSSLPVSPQVGQAVGFSDASAGGPTSWTWAFGDGELSYAPSPSHTYASAGSFDVTLTVSNALDQRSTTKTVTVVPPPSAPAIAFFTANPPAIDPGQTTTLSWSSTGGNSAAIDRGVGAVAPTGSVGITPVLGVPYTLTVTGPGGTAQAAVTVAQLSHPEPERWVLPGIAYNDAWQSDVTIFNPGSQAMTLSLAFLDSTNPVYDPGLLVWKTVVLPAGGSRSWTNVLQSEFAAAKGHWGAILVRGDVAPVAPVFATRTYGPTLAGGTVGLSVPALSVSAGVRADSVAASSRLIGLKENASAYTNLGVVNLDSNVVVAEASFSDASGNPLGSPVTFNLGPYGVFQFAHVLSADPPAGAGYKPPVDAFSASVRIVSGTAVAPYATVIDALSKDPIAATPVSQASATYRMPGIVRVPGASGTLWRSDVVLQNTSAKSRNVKLTYVYRVSPSAPVAVTATRRLAAGQILELDDFVRAQLGLSEGDAGAYSNSWVDFSPGVEADGTTNSDPLLVIGKTYNDQPTGNVGLQVPGYTTGDGASQSGANKRLALTGLASSAAYRTNLAFFVVDPNAALPQVTATVKVLDANGTVIKQVPIALDSMTGFVQRNDAELFADLPAAQRAQMSVVVEGISGNAAIAGYATIIDNVTGDATFVQAVPTP